MFRKPVSVGTTVIFSKFLDTTPQMPEKIIVKPGTFDLSIEWTPGSDGGHKQVFSFRYANAKFSES